MAAESAEPIDRPFPGARSQVPGMFRDDDDRSPAEHQEVPAQRTLPLESSAVRLERGWSVRLPVRAEHISLDKQVVVYERVQVRRRELEELERVEVKVRREELRVTTDRGAGVSSGARVEPERRT